MNPSLPSFLPILLPSPATPDDSLKRSVGLAKTFVEPFSILASSKPKNDLLGNVVPGFTHA